MAEFITSFIVLVSVPVLALYLVMCIHDRRNPIKFWHTHTWEEVYHRHVEGRYKERPHADPARKTLVIVNQCTTCKQTRKTEDIIF